MTTDQLKQQNDLTAAECDALLKLILYTKQINRQIC